MKTIKFAILFFVPFLVALSTHAQREKALHKKVEKFENGVVASESFFDNDRLVETRHYSSAGVFSGWTRFQYLPDNHVIKMDLITDKERFGSISKQEEWSGLDKNNREVLGVSIMHKKWFFENEAPYKLSFVASYEEKKPFRILRKEYFFANNKTLKSTISFSYQGDSEKPHAFVERLPRGKVISHFTKYEPIRDEKKRENSNKFLIAIIDSGFDYNHADLVDKWWNNPADPIDGQDNDGNGWVDDNFGWDQVANVGLPTESTISMANDERPLSHGTHVAHIAIRNLDQAALVGFAGDYTNPDYINQISTFIKTHKVRIVNLSIGLPKDTKNDLGLRDGINAQKRMIEDNPETLFVVAAGNESKNLDEYRNRQFPASFNFPNVLKVGALVTSTIEGLTPTTAKMAEYSNTGRETVDVLAPGNQIMAASLGGGLIAHSGTSMATPYAANMVARLWMEFPSMSAAEIRNLVIETAKPLVPAVDIASGGYLDLKAAQIQLRLKFLNSKKSQVEGPNCWNEATYVAGISKGLHHTTGSEFAFIIDSPLCQQIPMAEAEMGDIVALRRYDRQDRLFPTSLISEVHGYTYIDKNNGFTKNGTMSSAGYETMSHQDIFDFYKKSEYRGCKQFGLERVDCNLKPVVYRCTEIENILVKRGKMKDQECETLMQVEYLERHLQHVVLTGQSLSFDKVQKLAILKEKIKDLEGRGSSELLIEYLQHRLESIEQMSHHRTIGD